MRKLYTIDAPAHTNKRAKRTLGERGDANMFHGKMKELGGKVQKHAGKLTGNKKLESKGRTREAAGKLQQGAGKVERKVHNALHPQRKHKPAE